MSLSWRSQWSATWRCLFIQGAWNFERLQNLGWAFCVEPALRELYPDPKARAEALQRHLEFFNTHPYMAGYVLGAALRAEEEASKADDEGRAPRAAQVSGLKLGLAGPLAAVGDAFYWATLRPAAALLGVAWLWLGPHPWHLYAPVVYLVAYNLPCFWLRLASVHQGYRRGLGVALHVAKLGLPSLAEGLRFSALLLVGGLAGGLGRVSHPGTGHRLPLTDNFLFLGGGLLMLLLLRLRMSPVLVWSLALLSTLVLAFAIP
jgi:mannose/fructose/N-acetylgalactosamine-specific phosphotransferase system component IID